jgi:imidazolonepropionase-like amidohydrolase
MEKHWRFVCLLVFLSFVVIGCAKTPNHSGSLAIVDCVLIDGTGSPPLSNAVVLIKDGIIKAVGSASETGGTEGYTRVNLHGAYLLPGFINAHVHSLYDQGNFRRWLSAGVTTARDLGYGTVFIDGTESARAAVNKYIGTGADLVKIAIEDDLQGRTWPMMSAGEVRAIVSQAHAANRKVSAHVSHVRNLPLAVDEGVDDIAHMVVEPLSEALARDIAEKGIIWVPTLELWKGVSAKHSLDWDKVAIRNTGVFFKAGGRIALGTDFNGYTIPFDSGFPITEAKLLLEAGLSPLDVIIAGTRNA